MGYKLVKFDASWADEIDIEGIKLFTDDEWIDFKALITRAYLSPDCSFSMCVGTNEDIEWSDVNDLLRDLRITDITEDEYNTLKKYVDDFGQFPWFDIEVDNE